MRPETEFELADYAFQKIREVLKKPYIDLFASRINAKCERFISWYRDPEAEAVDSFTVSWKYFDFYAFPPFTLITRVLQKIISDKAEGIVIVPFWPTQPWFPIFKSLLIKEPLYFQPNFNLLLSVDRTPHPLHRSLTLVAGLLSNKD